MPMNISYFSKSSYDGNLSEWHNKSIDLSFLAGRNIWIMFFYGTDTSVAYGGWYIDDITVTTDNGIIFSDTANNFIQWNNYNNGFSVVSMITGYDTLGHTAQDGAYSLSGLPDSFTLYSTLKGKFVDVANLKKPETNHSVDINPPSTHSWSWSSYDNSYKQEESNVFYHVNVIHDFFTKGSPFDIYPMNYQTVADVQYPGDCNAFSDGTNIHFFGYGNGCEATSLFSDIIYHEYL